MLPVSNGMRIVFVGGGTGGHFYPLMAIAEAIRDRDAARGSVSELYYMGPEPYNATALNEQNVQFVYCPAGKQRRYKSLRNIVDLFKIAYGILVALWKLLVLYPDVIMSKGGYTSVPVVLVAWWYRIPIVIHESDAEPGRANILAARFARYIGIAHLSTAEFFPKEKTAHTGVPIRSSFTKTVTNPHDVLGIKSDRPVIFITGGSLGAERVNDLVLDSLDELLPHYTVVHQTGENNFERVQTAAARLITEPSQQERYFIYGHMNSTEIAAAFEAATVIVSRAGAGTIAEIALKKKPAILIPIPEEISHDQRTNAYAYAELGAAIVIEEKNVSDGLLAAEIAKITSEPEMAAEMAASATNFTEADAAYKLADIVHAIGSEHE